MNCIRLFTICRLIRCRRRVWKVFLTNIDLGGKLLHKDVLIDYAFAGTVMREQGMREAGKGRAGGMHTIAWWPTVLTVVVATVTDIRSRRIPNWLVVPFLLAGISVSVWLHGWQGLGQSFEGIGLGAVIYGFLSFLGGMGMGDVKLMAAIGAWIGPLSPDRGWIGPLEHVGVVLILTALAGGIMAICWAVYAGFLGTMLRGTGSLLFGFARRGLRPHPELVLSNPQSRKMPYAPAIAIGTLLSFLAG